MVESTINMVTPWEVSASLSREEKIIIGTVLGDGHLAKLKTGVRLEISHSEAQKEYIFWKYEELKRFAGAPPYRVESFDFRYSKRSVGWRFHTRIHKIFERYYQVFYRDKKKVIPQRIEKILVSPLSLAVWFMDDGGKRKDCRGMFLNTLSFTKEENERLQKCLKKNFNIVTRIHWVKDGYRLYIPSSQSSIFCKIIFPYVLPSMRYKLALTP